MHKCPSCHLDCDCDRGLPGCEHLCVQLADDAAPSKRNMLTLAQIEAIYQKCASLQNKCSSALTYDTDEGFRQRRLFTSDILAMVELTRSDVNRERMARKKANRLARRAARSLRSAVILGTVR